MPRWTGRVVCASLGLARCGTLVAVLILLAGGILAAIGVFVVPSVMVEPRETVNQLRRPRPVDWTRFDQVKEVGQVVLLAAFAL